jgi:prophage regulatory protein
MNSEPLSHPSAATPTLERLLELPDVLTAVSLSRSAVYGLVSIKQFPAPVKIGKASRWVASEVDAWILARMKARSAVPVAA